MIVCGVCKTLTKLEDFPSDPIRRLGVVTTHCNKCKSIKQRELYKKKPSAIYENVKKYESKNSDKRIAWRKISELLKKGKIKKPMKCEVCNEIKELEAHHRYGYAGDNAILVVWLCRKCHKKESRL